MRSLRQLHSAWRCAGHRRRGRSVVHVLHIGKTGGTAIHHALRGHLVAGRHAIVFHGHGFRLRDVPVGDPVCFFLRDPASRFVSAFNSRKRKGRPRYYWPWMPSERRVYRRFETANELARALSSTEDEPRRMAHYAMRKVYHLRHSYPFWLEDEDYVRSRRADLLLVGFQETLAADLEKLKRTLDLPDDVALPEDDVLSHRTPDRFDKSLDAVAIANVKTWFEADYRLLALCREIAAEGEMA